ncbi:doxx family protein [Allomuricauda sp. SCSIO 65647]|uniref:doxx family protein n=1 Tax=Allomuricauda sp. SCSIO 65647 TaxID=2908843 RepID=UPI001F170021|nr:doxx family protein [Muricauda sp. SCSIO 65647]UJH68490.1 doxx family protein [Muricauda sp. SCSIO 65647]
MKERIKSVVEKLMGNHILALSIGFVYLWFGTLKFFPGMSPAEELAKNTIQGLTLGWLPDETSIVLLAALEVMIGLLLVLNIFRKQVIFVAMGHMVLTFTPMLFFPMESFKEAPLVPTLLGQYIGKNVIILCALITLVRKHKQISPMEKIED